MTDSSRDEIELEMMATLVGLGQEVQKRRKLLGLEIDRAARMAGFSVSCLREIEMGKKNISLDDLQSLAYALDMSCADLMRRAEITGAIASRGEAAAS